MRNMILGLSLAPLLEINAAGDFCRATQQILNELDNFVEALEKDKVKVVSRTNITPSSCEKC